MNAPIEHDLETLHHQPTPDPAFAARLQRELRARTERLENAASAPWEAPALIREMFRRTWGFAAVTALLLLAALFTFVGPQRVWASIQQFFRYVPDVGFVDLENARVLPAPVAVERAGITFIVTQVIAAADRTIVRYEIQGLPPEDEIWPEGADVDDGILARLRLPDGTMLDPQGMMLGMGNGQIEFPPLPAETARVTFEINRLPLTPPGMFPEAWAIPLPLRTIEGKLDETLFPKPYAPENAADTHFGITARVLQVAHAPEGTAVRLQIESGDPAWSTYVQAVQLHDDIGHRYNQSSEENTSSVQTMVLAVEETQEEGTPTTDAYEKTYVFYPTSLSAQTLTLEILGIQKRITLEGSFTIDLGDAPQVGDSWELNLPFEVAGVRARVTSARLVEASEETEAGVVTTKNLEFFIETEPGSDGRRLGIVSLENSQGWFMGSGAESSETGKNKAYFSMEADRPFPRGELIIQFVEAELIYPGPWTLTWPLPRQEDELVQLTRPLILHPDTRDTHSDITLRLAETVQTDLLLALALEAENLPAETEFLSLVWGTKEFSPDQVSLTDNFGNAAPIYPWWKINWGPYKETKLPPTRVTFAPPHPLASRLTLTIPAVRLLLSAATRFDVTLPPDMPLVTEVTRDPSDVPPEGSWEVDIPIEVAGFQIHFTRAWLEEWNDPVSLVLFAEDINRQQEDYFLTSLQIETVLTPNGQTWVPNMYPAVHGVAGRIPGSTSDYAILIINVFDPQQSAVLPGTYHVQLNGVIVTVPGPWELSWDLMGP